MFGEKKNYKNAGHLSRVYVLSLKKFIKKRQTCKRQTCLALSGAFKKKHICYIFSMPTILFNARNFKSYARHVRRENLN